MFIIVAMIAFTARLAAAAPEGPEPDHDDGLLRDPAEAGVDPAWSDPVAGDAREAARHRLPNGLGRVDLTISWRRTVRVADMRGTHPDGGDPIHTIASPLDPVTTARGVLWVLLTWSR